MDNGFTTPPWWEALYDDLIAEILLAHRPTTEITAIGNFLLEQLQLRPGDTVFDQCCGIGTLSIELARRGMTVVGVDQSPTYIARAQRDAANFTCTFTAADGRDFQPSTTCRAAFNWGTSFGNFPHDAENLALLRRAFDALEPGGRFLLDYQHIPRVLREFQRSLLYRHPTPAGEVLLIRESRVDWLAGVLHQRWTIVRPDGTREERPSAVRLYAPHELALLLHQAGYVDLQGYGNLNGSPMELDSPRCMLIARRPR